MGPRNGGSPIRESCPTQFVLDAHHLAVLDRFVARARRQARRRGREFAGVVVEVDPARPVSVSATDLAPLILGADVASTALGAAVCAASGPRTPTGT